MSEGKILAFHVTNKHKDEFVVSGHSLPSNLDVNDINLIKSEIQATCNNLEYYDGCLNFDVIVNSAGATVIELSPRTGGNGIYELIKFSTGDDFIEASLKMSLGYKYEFSNKNPKSIGTIILGSSKSGILRKLPSEDYLFSSIDELLYLNVGKKVNDKIFELTDNSQLIAYAIFDFGDSDYQTVVNKIKDKFTFSIS